MQPSDWPNRARFQKKFQPKGIRICEETLDEICDYHDCELDWIESGGEIRITIHTREGELKAFDGDWVMEDSQGSHYPIDQAEIRKTYEITEPL